MLILSSFLHSQNLQIHQQYLKVQIHIPIPMNINTFLNKHINSLHPLNSISSPPPILQFLFTGFHIIPFLLHPHLPSASTQLSFHPYILLSTYQHPHPTDKLTSLLAISWNFQLHFWDAKGGVVWLDHLTTQVPWLLNGQLVAHPQLLHSAWLETRVVVATVGAVKGG